MSSLCFFPIQIAERQDGASAAAPELALLAVAAVVVCVAISRAIGAGVEDAAALFATVGVEHALPGAVLAAVEGAVAGRAAVAVCYTVARAVQALPDKAAAVGAAVHVALAGAPGGPASADHTGFTAFAGLIVAALPPARPAGAVVAAGFGAAVAVGGAVGAAVHAQPDAAALPGPAVGVGGAGATEGAGVEEPGVEERGEIVGLELGGGRFFCGRPGGFLGDFPGRFIRRGAWPRGAGAVGLGEGGGWAALWRVGGGRWGGASEGERQEEGEAGEGGEGAAGGHGGGVTHGNECGAGIGRVKTESRAITGQTTRMPQQF